MMKESVFEQNGLDHAFTLAELCCLINFFHFSKNDILLTQPLIHSPLETPQILLSTV